MSPAREVYPHEKRVQRYGYAALGATTLVGAIIVATGDTVLLGLEIPLAASLGVLLLGAIAGAVAVARRTTWIVLVAALLLALAALPAGASDAGVADYALGLLFALSLLLFGELVHMMERYERAHRAVDEENVPEEHINRVTDEALRTLAQRAGITGLAVAGAVGLAFLLAAVGPRQWRAAVETTAPLGVAVAGLALALVASLFILARGAQVRLRLRREKQPKEMLPDVAE